MRLAWITDPHFEFISLDECRSFGIRVARGTPCDAALITGDVADGESLEASLEAFHAGLRRPIYFVLGNHDFYGSSFDATEAIARRLGDGGGDLRYLPAAGPVAMGPGTTLVGHGGWYDARYGDPEGNIFALADFELIRDLRGLSRRELIDAARARGDRAAAEAAPALEEALSRSRRVFFATHVPPFREAAWHLGRPSDENALPWFAPQAMGDLLTAAARDHPDREIVVLCGHTHSPGEATIRPNLRAITAGARYGSPAVAAVIE